MFYFFYLFNFSVVESSSGDLIDIIVVIISFYIHYCAKVLGKL